jgi:hypothetical protein
MIAYIFVGALLVYLIGYFNGGRAELDKISKDVKEILKHD